MENDGIVRLKQHADLVQQLVKQVPAALNRSSLTLEQASRLHAVIEKGVQDFDQVQQRVTEPDVDESYHRAASSLAKIWSHLAAAAAEKIRELGEAGETENSGDAPLKNPEE